MLFGCKDALHAIVIMSVEPSMKGFLEMINDTPSSKNIIYK
jgi:hypothetical protein